MSVPRRAPDEILPFLANLAQSSPSFYFHFQGNSWIFLRFLPLLLGHRLFGPFLVETSDNEEVAEAVGLLRKSLELEACGAQETDAGPRTPKGEN